MISDLRGHNGTRYARFFVLNLTFYLLCCFCFLFAEDLVLLPVSVVVVPCPSTCGEDKPIVDGSALRFPMHIHLHLLALEIGLHLIQTCERIFGMKLWQVNVKRRCFWMAKKV